MALDKLVDSVQLDSDLAAVADAIRSKGGTSAQLSFPSDFVSAIGAIETGGGGNSIYSGTFTPAENTLGPTIDVGADFTHFVVFADTNPSASDNVKKFFAAVCDFSRAGNDVITIASNNTGSALIGGFYAYKWFAKSGTTVRCTNTGTSGQASAGYWVGGVTYNWFAW